jgi:hypothetical protein
MHLLNSDFMYAFFCFGAAIFVSLSTLRLLKQKQVRGVNFLEPMWFLGWGFVNLYVFWGYSLSFISSVLLVSVELFRFVLMVYYTRKESLSKISVDY